MSKCGDCNDVVSRNSISLNCKTCGSRYHPECRKVTTELAEQLNVRIQIWLCQLCTAKTLSLNNQEGIKLSDIMKELLEIKNEQKRMSETQKNLIHTLESYREEMSDLDKKVKTLDQDIRNIKENFDTLVTELGQQEKRNCELEYITNYQEQQLRINCLEIAGVPEPQGENLFSTLAFLSVALGFKLDINMIDCLYRRGGRPATASNTNPTQHKIFVVKFVRRSDKDEFLRCRKVKRDFSTKDLDRSLAALVTKPNTIYVNESLTKDNRILLTKTKIFRKQNNIKHLWTKNGQIFLRKSDNSKIYLIKNEDDFRDVH